MEDLINLVSEMKIKDNNDRNKIINKIKSQETLTTKCIMACNFLPPQSNSMEMICKEDLQIQNSLDEISGDGIKNGIKYEIKISIHAKKSNINFVQLRPDHKIDFYIFIAYNLYDKEKIGKAYIFKVPAENIYSLILDYGGYAHGTVKNLGKITKENIKGRNCEFALRCNPNATRGNNFKLWNELLKYEVEYLANNF